MNSLGDNRSSKILFGKRKNWPLQFLRIQKPPSKLFERVFSWSENQKEKHRSKNSLYYTEKNFRFVRVFCKILYTLFTFHFTIEKILLYNTEKKLGFVDVFLEKFINYFHVKKVRSICRANLILYLQLLFFQVNMQHNVI